jgi:hypothetical protein
LRWLHVSEFRVEGGSVDGWTSPQESVASVAGKGNTLGGSSAGVTILGGFWGLQTVNLNPNRDSFLKAKFLSFDLTFIQADLSGAGYAQTKEFALHDSSGSFVQRQIATGAAGAKDSDSLMPAATAGQWQGMDGTRTIKIDLNSFAAPSPQATMGETSYKQYLKNHTELLVPGDFDQNGTVDRNDIPAMLKALTDLAAYKANHNNMSDATLASIGDFNDDGFVTNADIQGLLDSVASSPGGGSVTVVPEPSGAVLFVLGLAAAVIARRKSAALDRVGFVTT